MGLWESYYPIIKVIGKYGNLRILKDLKKVKLFHIIWYLNGKIICEATAILASNIIQNSKDLVGNGAIYILSGFEQ